MALINELKQILELIGACQKTWQRLNVTARCYIQECIGNACKNDTFFSCYREVQDILHFDITERVFRDFDATSLKKRMAYQMIKKKAAIILIIYYRIRNRKRK